MQKINKKLEEAEIIYKKKIADLSQVQGLLTKLQTECVNLEGQIKVLKELKQELKNENSS